MTIGILYIATGKYTIFWKEFYRTAEQYLFPGVTKKYFIFSDMSEIYGAENNPNVVLTSIEHREWPYNTLLRFDLFYNNKILFEGCDYLLFYNANTIFTTEIQPEEILPKAENDWLVALCNKDVIKHKTPDEHTYDRNPLSTAYIPLGQGKEYYRGCFNGGRTPEFLQLIKVCKEQTEIDIQNNAMALWHDESHLNKYLIDKSVKIVTSVYGKHQGWNKPKQAKVIFLEKAKVFDVDTFKGKNTKRISLSRFIAKVKKKLIKK